MASRRIGAADLWCGYDLRDQDAAWMHATIPKTSAFKNVLFAPHYRIFTGRLLNAAKYQQLSVLIVFDPIAPLTSNSSIPAARSADHEALREVAKSLEATFLAEMLKHAGFGDARDSFGGGVGESQFSSFLLQERANSLADRGGIGLAESLFEALVRRAERAE